MNYIEGQLEHAVGRAEDEGEEVPVLREREDMGSTPAQRGKEVLPGMCDLPLVQRECIDEEGSDDQMESAKELHIEALVSEELDRIVKEHGLFASDHEAWAVIREELEEALEDHVHAQARHNVWWKRIREDDTDNLDIIDEIEKYSIEAIKELVQVVACARKWKQGHLKDWVESKAVKV